MSSKHAHRRSWMLQLCSITGLAALGCSSDLEPGALVSQGGGGGQTLGTGNAAAAAGTNTFGGAGGSAGSGANPSGSGTAGMSGIGTNSGAAGVGPGTAGTSAAMGGTAGSGGINARRYPHGFVPSTVSALEAANAYASWKESYLEDCGGGVYRVRWDNPDQTVSEGIAYGMLLAVSHDEQSVFDGLWAYYNENLDERGLMHWQREGCEGTQPTENSNNAATDADLDAAMALLMASCRWSAESYASDADRLIQAIREHETTEAEGLLLLKPGDVFGGADCLNASYFAPAYYRAFAERAQNEEDRNFWLTLSSDSYALIERMDNDATGLVPNWADMNGNTDPSGPPGCPWYTDAHIYSLDAARTPWRVAVDYLWWGTPEARTWLTKVVGWVQGQGISSVGHKYELDGTPFGPIEHSVISLGAFANAAMAVDQTLADEFATEFARTNDSGYFPDSLRSLSLLVAAGRFTTCGGLSAP